MYSDYYGLSERPFQLTPDPRFYFDSATHKKAMAYLGYGLTQGEGFIVITGEIGSGKTMLVRHLMATIDSERLTAVQIGSTQVEGDDMLRLTAQSFGLAAENIDKAQLLDRVERFLKRQTDAGRRTLLIVDEAQNLGTSALEELRMLSNFQAGGESLLQIFLLAQPEFRERLEKSGRLEQLRQRIIARHHLEPMGEDEVEPYIRHRLSQAAWRGNPSFTPDAFAVMHRFSGGLPRRLNLLASRLLLLGAIERLDTIDAAAVETVIADFEAEGEGIEPGDAPDARPAAPVIAFPQFARQASEPDEDLRTRVAGLEAQLAEQEATLRRILTLLVDWVEREDAPDLDVVRTSQR